MTCQDDYFEERVKFYRRKYWFSEDFALTQSNIDASIARIHAITLRILEHQERFLEEK